MRIDRRGLLIGGGAGIGLVIAWAGWPRSYRPNLAAAPDETVIGGWLKIARDGRVIVALPQVERGQGVFTALAQIVADELGADWRTVGVEAAPLNPRHANPIAAAELFGPILPPAIAAEHARRALLVLTGGSSSIRAFAEPAREAGAAARVLLAQAAARRWDVPWQACGTGGGFVTHGDQRLRFAELAEAAPAGEVPDPLPYRSGERGRLTGVDLPRLDAPAKVDGSANFAADIRLPDMVHAAVREGPIGTVRLRQVDRAAADRVPGLLQVVTAETWVAAIGTTAFAAARGLDALAPRFETRGAPGNGGIERALDAALAAPGYRIAAAGDLSTVFRRATIFAADYRVDHAVHAAIETPAATAHWRGDRLELWVATDAPGRVRAAAARAIGIAADRVIVHPMLVGGSFGEALETDTAARAAVLAVRLEQPVQVMRGRTDALRTDRPRPAVAAKLSARLAPSRRIAGWQARIAAPPLGHALARRLLPGDPAIHAALATARGDAAAVAGATPPYRIPAFAIDHHPADTGVPPGHLRGGADGYTAFFTEGFIDELAHAAGIEAMSFRIAMLGGDARLARCLTTAAALGGWDGGVAGSGQGIACHTMRGSCIAVLAEAHLDEARRVRVDRLVAAVDCGQQIAPDLVRQQIEGGLIFGMAAALGAATGYDHGIATARGFGDLGLPTLADTPDIIVELIASDEAPGGVSELGVPAVAPAIANAVRSATGLRLRALPLRPEA